MRTSLFILLALAVPSWGQEVPLAVKGGDVKIVKVDQITVVKVDRTVVTSFPFTLTAPAGCVVYWWKVPAGVAASDVNEVLTVTAAPKGDCVISVKMLTVDFEKKSFATTYGSLAFSIGDVGPPPAPPVPPAPPTPLPVSALQAALQVAYNAELDPAKATKLAAIADLLESAVKVAKKSTTIKTAKDFTEYVDNAYNLHTEIGKGALPVVAKVIGANLAATLPTAASTPANDAYWTAADAAYSNVAQALKGVK